MASSELTRLAEDHNISRGFKVLIPERSMCSKILSQHPPLDHKTGFKDQEISHIIHSGSFYLLFLLLCVLFLCI